MTWQTGERVIIRSGGWRVMRATQFTDCEALDVTSERSPAARTFLLPFDRPRSASVPRPRVVSRKRWAHEVGAAVRASYPYGGLRFCPPAIRLLPYQLEPALAVLRHGALRLLVADEVGLGKTVEAGLVVREVAKADRLSRVLVLCPASLRAQWAREMDALFELQVVEADSVWLRRVTRELPADVNPWSVPGIYLASMDFVKRPEALYALEDVRWDLLIVDEAHAATPGSDRRAAVHALACRARRLMLLTATPHSGDEEQFAGLCRIGSTRGSAPIVLFSRARSETAVGSPGLRSLILPVRPTDAERRSHSLLEDYTARVWKESKRRGDQKGELVATVLRKRALSSAGSLALSVRRRLQLLTGATPAPAQMWLPLGDEDALEDEAPNAVLAAAGLDEAAEERQALAAIAQAAEAASASESKIRVLLRLLKRVREPAIVFSEYRDTVQRLHAHLSGAGHRVCTLHGGLSAPERHGVVTTFASGRSLLVATDAASEGLNLHYSCRLVIHFELPWSATRMEQRCGRVNRIGQTRRVHEIALVANHTSEQMVLLPLLRRAARSRAFSKAAMMRGLAESAVARHLLGGAPLDLPPATWNAGAVTTMNLQEEAREEARRLELLRRIDRTRRKAATQAPRREAAIPITRAKRCAPGGQSFDVLVGISLRDTQGGTFEHAVVPISFRIGPVSWSRRAGPLQAQIALLLEGVKPALGRVVREIIEARQASADSVRTQALAALHDREEEIRREAGSASRRLVQAGLFDRRALVERDRRVRARASLQEEEQARFQWVPRGETNAEAIYEVRAIRVGSGC